MSKSTGTEVTQVYTAGKNVSLTVRDGRLDSVTTWTTGVSKSTKRNLVFVATTLYNKK